MNHVNDWLLLVYILEANKCGWVILNKQDKQAAEGYEFESNSAAEIYCIAI